MSGPIRTHQSVLEEIQNYPEVHQHSFESLKSCAYINGAIDLLIIQAHEGLGCGPRCDVWEGQCSCGATHERKKRDC